MMTTLKACMLVFLAGGLAAADDFRDECSRMFEGQQRADCEFEMGKCDAVNSRAGAKTNCKVEKFQLIMNQEYTADPYAQTVEIVGKRIRDPEPAAQQPKPAGADHPCSGETGDNLDRCMDLQKVPKSQSVGQQAGQANAVGSETLIGQCRVDTKAASDFCTNPIESATDQGLSDETANVAIQLGMMAGTIAKSDEGVNGLCNMGAATGASMAGLNGVFAGRCSSLITDCETSCSLEAIKSDPEVVALKRTCSAQRRKAAALTSQASVQATGAMMSKLCANASKATPTAGTIPPPVVPVPTGDCSGANATSPLCRTQPPGGGYTGGGGAGFDYAGGGSSGSEAGMNVGDLDSATTQSAKPEATEGAASANAGVPNGGGQMLGGQDSGGGGGGDEGGRGGAGGGQNANVLQGERSGGGYSVSPGGALAASGGWGGYGAGGAGDTEKRDKFDLSKYLPGGKNAPARGPAGLGRAGAEIAAAHEDIFKKISDRVKVVCRTNRLMDCN